MELHKPFMISSRLMPGLEIAGATLSLDTGKETSEGRTCYQVWIDLPNGTEHEITDLRSGCGGGSIQEGFKCLLSFLSAAAESRQYRERTGRTGENEELFPADVVDWASQNSDEIGMLQCEIEDTPGLIVE